MTEEPLLTKVSQKTHSRYDFWDNVAKNPRGHVLLSHLKEADGSTYDDGTHKYVVKALDNGGFMIFENPSAKKTNGGGKGSFFNSEEYKAMKAQEKIDIAKAQLQTKQRHSQLMKKLDSLIKIIAYQLSGNDTGGAAEILEGIGFEEYKEDQEIDNNPEPDYH